MWEQDSFPKREDYVREAFIGKVADFQQQIYSDEYFKT